MYMGKVQKGDKKNFRREADKIMIKASENDYAFQSPCSATTLDIEELPWELLW